MELSNQITISDIVNIILALISLSAIILSYRTLKEMEVQRKLSVKPHLVILNQNNSVRIDNINDEHSRTKFELTNIGSGLAKDIKIKILLDFNDISKLGDKIKIDGGLINVDNTFFILENIKRWSNININAIGSQNKIEFYVDGVIDFIIKSLITTISFEDKSFDKNITVKVNLRYKDVINNEYESDYEMILEFGTLTFNENHDLKESYVEIKLNLEKDNRLIN
ncbi:hypothetical protein UT300017_11660 [Clostridium sp. CTA-17]